MGSGIAHRNRLVVVIEIHARHSRTHTVVGPLLDRKPNYDCRIPCSGVQSARRCYQGGMYRHDPEDWRSISVLPAPNGSGVRPRAWSSIRSTSTLITIMLASAKPAGKCLSRSLDHIVRISAISSEIVARPPKAT